VCVIIKYSQLLTYINKKYIFIDDFSPCKEVWNESDGETDKENNILKIVHEIVLYDKKKN